MAKRTAKQQGIALSPNRSKPVRFQDMPARDFEEMCCSLISKEDGILSADITKRPRQLQYGADVIAERTDQNGIEVASCKCYTAIRKKQFKKFSDEFLDHWDAQWKVRKVKRFVLCIASDISAGERETEREAEKTRFNALGVAYEVWSPRQLQEKLRPHYGIANQHLGKEIANLICCKPQASISSSGDGEIINDALVAQLKELKNGFSERTEHELEAARESVRQGKTKKITDYLVQLEANPSKWGALAKKTRAAILRFKGLLALDARNVDEAIKLCDEADAIEASEEPRLRALIARKQDGVEEALKILHSPKTRDGLHIQASFLIEKKLFKDALDILAKITPSEINAETHRLSSVAYMYQGLRNEALYSIEIAEKLSPQWVSIIRTGTIIRYFSALSPCVKFEAGIWPTSIAPALFLERDESQKLLSKAEETFNSIAFNAPELEDKNAALLWKMACISGLKSRSVTDMKVCFDNILQTDNAHAGAIVWALSYGFDFDYALSKKSIEDLISSSKAEAHHILAYAAIETNLGNSEAALIFLNNHKTLFAGLEGERLFSDWSLRIEALSKKNNKGLNKNSLSTLPAAISNFRKSKNSAYLSSLIKQGKVGAVEIFSILCVFSEYGRWDEIESQRELLIKQVQTPQAIALAAFSAYHNNDYTGCVEILKHNKHAFSGGNLPTDLRRLEIAAARKAGDVVFAQNQAFKLAAEFMDLEDIIELASTSVQIGDIEIAIPYIQRLVDHASLKGEQALQLASIIKSVKPDLHKTLVQKALKLGTPQALIPLAIREGLAANLGSELAPLFGEMQTMAAADGQSLISHKSLDEAQEIISQQRERSNHVWNLYTEGKIPLHFLCAHNPENIAYLYWKAFNQNEKFLSKPAIFSHHGSRKIAEKYEVEFKNWNLHLDITSLFIAYSLGLLEQFEKLEKIFTIPHHIQSILLHIENELLHPQPDRIKAFKEIINLQQQGRLAIVKASDAPKEGSAHIGFEKSENAGEYVNLRGLANSLVFLGGLNPNKLPTVIDKLGLEGSRKTEGELKKGQEIVFDFNTIELVASSGILTNICNIFKPYTQEHYYHHITEEVRLFGVREHVVEWVSTLRNTLADLLKRGACKALPYNDSVKRQDAGTPLDLSICIFELLKVGQENSNTLWIDDRCLNGHLSAEEKPIVSTHDVLAVMRQEGLIDKAFYFEALIKLRSAFCVFIPIAPEEVLYQLEKSPKSDNRLIETPSLKILRTSFSRSLVLENKLNLIEQKDYIAATKQGEFNWLVRSFRLADELLPLIWQRNDIDHSQKRVWSEWVWQSLRVERFDRTPLNNPSIAEKANIFAMTTSGLFTGTIAFPIKTASLLRKEYLNWVYHYIFMPKSKADKAFSEDCISWIKRQLTSFMKEDVLVAKPIENSLNLMKEIVLNLIQDLPEPLEKNLLEDKIFMSVLGINTTQTISMNSYSFVADEFWNSIHQTLETGAASISTFNKKDTLDFKLLDDSKVYIPTLQLSGCFSGQMSDTALPLVSTKTKAEDFSITACANGWIDYPAKEALSLINGLLNEKSYFQRIKNYDNIREKSATYIYARLENEMATSQNIKWDFFFPPDCETLSRYLRLDFQTQDTMAVIEKSALGLMSQYGASEAFERISNLPVSIPDIIVSEMLKEHENGTYDLSEKIFSPSDGVISTFQKLRLQFQLQNALGIEDVLIIQFVKDFLNDWPEKVLAFVQVLKWAHRIVNDLPDAQQYRPEQRLLFTWLHGGTIFKIVFNGTKRPFSAIQEIFDNMDFYTAEQYITNDVPFDEIAEKPEGISPEYLLLQGLNYSCASDKSLEIIASLSKEIQSVVCVKDMTEIVSPFIFNGRSNAKKRIGQFFTASAQELMDRFKLGFSAKIVITSGFDNLFENALLKISSQETCLDGWAMLRIYGTEWLNDHQLKEIRSHLKSFNVSSLLEKDRDFTLKACRTISDFSVRGIAPEAQEIIQKMIMDIATYLSSLHKGADCTAEDTIQYTDLLQLSEIVFSFAEGLDLRLSVDSFCTTIRTVINIWPESAAFWKPVLNNFNNGIRFEYTDPIWKIYNETRIYD